MNYIVEKKFNELMFDLFILREDGNIEVKELLKDITIDNLLHWIDWAFENPELAKTEYPLIADILFKLQIDANHTFVFAQKILSFPKYFNDKTLPEIQNCKIKKLKIDLININVDFVGKLLETEFKNKIEQHTINKLKPVLTEIKTSLLKELENEKQGGQVNEPNTNNDVLSILNSLGADKCFRYKKEYLQFATILNNYFKSNQDQKITIPKQCKIFEIINKEKGRTSQYLRFVFDKKYTTIKSISKDFVFLNILRLIDIYQNDTERQILRKLQRDKL